MALLAVLGSGCDEPDANIVGPFSGTTYRYTVDSLSLPTTNNEAREYAGDLNGDGVPDNQLGLTIATLYGMSDITTHASDMIGAGVIATSLEVTADDLMNDPTVGVRYLGTPESPSVQLGGKLVNGSFRSNLVARAAMFAENDLLLPAFKDADPSLVHTMAMEIFFEPDTNGDGGLTVTVHAALKGDATFANAVHAGIAQMVASDPGDHRAMLNLLDVNPRDGVISLDEVVHNGYVISLLAPDVTINGVQALALGFRAHVRPCESGLCNEAISVEHCFDRVLDGDETDLDCGGSCRSCQGGAACVSAADCATPACDQGRCVQPSCTDGVLDGVESDIDCGGGVCPRCSLGQRCYNALDCTSSVCNGTCSPNP